MFFWVMLHLFLFNYNDIMYLLRQCLCDKSLILDFNFFLQKKAWKKGQENNYEAKGVVFNPNSSFFGGDHLQ